MVDIDQKKNINIKVQENVPKKNIYYIEQVHIIRTHKSPNQFKKLTRNDHENINIIMNHH